MLETANTRSELIFIARVTQQEAFMLHQGMYQPKIEQPLEQTFLSDKQVKEKESASIPKIFEECGYNRNMHFVIRGRPKTLGVAGLYSFKTIIKATRVQHFF